MCVEMGRPESEGGRGGGGKRRREMNVNQQFWQTWSGSEKLTFILDFRPAAYRTTWRSHAQNHKKSDRKKYTSKRLLKYYKCKKKTNPGPYL